MARRNRASVSRRTSSPRRMDRTRGCSHGVATSTVTQNITQLRMRELLVPPSNGASRLTWELRERVTSSPKLEVVLARSTVLDDKWRRFSQSRVALSQRPLRLDPMHADARTILERPQPTSSGECRECSWDSTFCGDTTALHSTKRLFDDWNAPRDRA